MCHEPGTDACPDLWGLTEATRLWIGGHDDATKQVALSLVGPCVRPERGPLDVALLTPATIGEAVYFAAKLRRRLLSGGRLWVVGDTRLIHSISGDSICRVGYERDSQVVAVGGFESLGFKTSL